MRDLLARRRVLRALGMICGGMMARRSRLSHCAKSFQRDS